MKVERCNGSHTMTMVMNPVSLTKDGPNMKAWEEMRAPEDEHNLIIRSFNPYNHLVGLDWLLFKKKLVSIFLL